MTPLEKAQAVEAVLLEPDWVTHRHGCPVCSRKGPIYCSRGSLIARFGKLAGDLPLLQPGETYEVHYSDGTIEHRVA